MNTARRSWARKEEIVGWLVRETGATVADAEFEWSLVRSVMGESASMPDLVEGPCRTMSDAHWTGSRAAPRW